MSEAKPNNPNEQQAKRHEREAKWQRIAFAEIERIDYWFRKQFNLAPTDPRYLNANREQMWVEYWCYQFDMMMDAAKEEGKEIESLADMLQFIDEKGVATDMEMSDDEFYRRVREMDHADDLKAGAPPSRVALASNPKETEPVVIKFRRPMNGRRTT